VEREKYFFVRLRALRIVQSALLDVLGFPLELISAIRRRLDIRVGFGCYHRERERQQGAVRV